MKKKWYLLLAVVLVTGMLTGCTDADGGAKADETQETGAEAPEETGAPTETEAPEAPGEGAEADAPTEETEAPDEGAETAPVRLAALKGPTSMGLAGLWNDNENSPANEKRYDFDMMTAADEILPLMVKGELDIALIPANAAAVLYQKTEGGIAVIDINTLGVLYLVSGDTDIKALEDLAGKTVYLTGKGTTPDYVLTDLLARAGLTEQVTLSYKSEAAEVAALLQENPDAVGLLPQPFVTAACAQNEALAVVLDVNAQWEALHDGKGIVTGVTVVRREFCEEHPEAVQRFLEDHAASAAFANEQTEKAAELVAAMGIVEKAPVAQKAMPACNIVCIEGEEMKEMLSSYLAVLEEQNAEFIGGSVPGEDFYQIF